MVWYGMVWYGMVTYGKVYYGIYGMGLLALHANLRPNWPKIKKKLQN